MDREPPFGTPSAPAPGLSSCRERFLQKAGPGGRLSDLINIHSHIAVEKIPSMPVHRQRGRRVRDRYHRRKGKARILMLRLQHLLRRRAGNRIPILFQRKHQVQRQRIPGCRRDRPMEGNRIDARLIQKKASASFRMGDRRSRGLPVQVENQRRPGAPGRSRHGIGGQIFRRRSRSGRAGASCGTCRTGDSRRPCTSCGARRAGSSCRPCASRGARRTGDSRRPCTSCGTCRTRDSRRPCAPRWARASGRARRAGADTGRSLSGTFSAAPGRSGAAGNTALSSCGLRFLFCMI